MELIRNLLEGQPLMALFLVVTIGYLLGELRIRGFSFGVGAVLFVALAVGWFAPGAVPDQDVATLGLALFLYAIGIQYGPEFFAGLRSRRGVRANLIGLTATLISGLTAVLLARRTGLSLGHGLGLFAGATTSTPVLQAALASIGTDDPAVGYSVAYPLGVAVPMLCMYLSVRLLEPHIESSIGSGVKLIEINLTHPAFFGKRLGEVTSSLPQGVRIVALRRGDRNHAAAPDIVIANRDVLLAVATSEGVLDEARTVLGDVAAAEATHDRRHLDYLRMFASRPAVIGCRVADLHLPGRFPSVVAQVRRGDTELQVQPDLVLEFGDRVGVLAHRSDFDAMRRYFGDSIRSTAEFSYISIGLGMALGFLFGAIAVPVPGIGRVSLGLSGVLIVALTLGYARRTAAMSWTVPLAANLVLRNFGLTLFLAQVGMASGERFVSTVAQTGVLLLALSALSVAAVVLPILVIGLLVLRLPYDEVAGILSGTCSNPAILAYANRQAGEGPDRSYAIVFPGMMVLKILLANIMAGAGA